MSEAAQVSSGEPSGARDVQATYRRQLRDGVDLDRVATELDRLRHLGVSHVYLSPVFTASSGSSHGYDVVDPTEVDPALGGDDAFARLAEQAAASGLGVVLDIVPNHMALSPENPYLWDVLARGPESRWAAMFDIDWHAPDERLRGRLVVPVLGARYGEMLESGALQLGRDGTRLVVRMQGLTMPVDPSTVAVDGDVDIVDIGAINRDPERLDIVLEAQHYRLTSWRVAADEVDYRRFFDIQSLVALRQEEDDTYRTTHVAVERWAATGSIAGVRVDHVDGLRDPRGYLCRLRDSVGDAWLVVEKILAKGEQVPDDWPVDGTTGYEFLALVNGLFIDPDGYRALVDEYVKLAEVPNSFETVLREAKGEVVDQLFSADVRALVDLFVAWCQHEFRLRDHSRREVREVLRAFLVELPVYRTYVEPDGHVRMSPARDEDERAIGVAVEGALMHHRVEPALVEALRRVLLGREPAAEAQELRARFQQLSGPVMAKGKEDRALYRWAPLASANDVGTEPADPCTTVAQFHEHNLLVARRWPRTMLALTTHDTKRSEDVRARLNVLSEVPVEWKSVQRRWFEAHAGWWGDEPPDPVLQLQLYQTLLGARPISRDRVHAYVEKASREASQRTSWRDPEPAYEHALHDIIDRVMDDPTFATSLERFGREREGCARRNSRAQRLLQLTSPGVPDIYQGTEDWSTSLVDPDNRRPIDHDALDRAAQHAGPDTKIGLVRRALTVRRSQVDAFGPASTYEPLEARGPGAGHVVAFARGSGQPSVVTVAARLAHHARWEGTTVGLPPGDWHDALSGTPIGSRDAEVGPLLGASGAVLLVRDGSETA